ncbi:MAG: F0F1 ATP synthase subunit delta [Pseudomonadota bacterium]|jgi:F-type H+-transporting ATPase subunit delta
MSSQQTLARPYARAAFESAQGAGALADWQRKLAFAAAVAGHPDVRGMVGNPRIDAATLRALFLPESEASDSTFAAFIGLLGDNRRLSALPEIAADYGELKREHEKVLKVTVRAAVSVDAALAESFKAALKRRYQREIELEAVLDPTVIGGAVIDAGKEVIDGSVRGRLERLSQALTA